MNARTGRHYARLGWLGTTLALAIALVAGSWLNYRSAQSAVQPLNRGQADLLEAAIREVVHPYQAVDSAGLAAFLAAHEATGLRYVALIASDGSVTASAGESSVAPGLPPRDSAADGGKPLILLGDRVRAFFPRPPVMSEVRRPRDDRERDDRLAAGLERGLSDEPDRRRRAQAGGMPPRSTHYHLIEFEPVIASALVTRAGQSFALALAGAGILTLAALLFWRTSDRYAKALFRLEEQKRLTVLGEMSAVLAHEIRNPLASLKGHAQLLSEKLPAESREKLRVERVIGEAARLEALTSDLLDFARSGPLELMSVDPAKLVRTSIADVAEDGFELDASGAPARWMLDEKRIRQVLVNVLENARQASANGRHPGVRVTAGEDRLILEVRDFGPGLPSGSEARIFDPFFTTRTNGTGLGLAVARRVVEMHGGEITARNHPEGGAVFRIDLPRR